MRTKRINILTKMVLGLLLMVVIVGALIAIRGHHARQAPNLPAGTFGSGAPALPNGMYDFTVPLNEYWSKGVAAEENAAIPLLRLSFGGPEQQIIREGTLKELGIDWDPKTDVHVQAIPIEISRLSELSRSSLSWLSSNPPEGPADYFQLAPEDRHVIQRWVDDRAELFAILKEAASRPKIFLPFVNWDPDLPLYRKQFRIHELRFHFTEVLSLAAVAELDRGNIDAAINHVVTGYRLSRRLSHIARIHSSWSNKNDFYSHPQRPDPRIFEAAMKLLESETMSKSDIQRLIDELENLPPRLPYAESIDTVERLALLDRAIGGAVVQLSAYRTLENGFWVPGPRRFWIPTSIRDVQAMFASSRDVLTVDNRNKMAVELHELMDQSVRILESPEDFDLSTQILLQPTDSINLPAQTAGWLKSFASELEETQYVEYVMDTRVQLLRLGLHIEQYRLENGRLPDELSELSDDVPAELFSDSVSGAKVQYQADGNRFIISLPARNSEGPVNPFLLRKMPANSSDIR